MSAKSPYEATFDDLPEEWGEVPIVELGKVLSGSTPSRDVPTYWGGDIPWVTPGELTGLRSKYISQTIEAITPDGLNGSGANLLPQNSLLITTRATLGSRAINTRPMATNQGFKCIVFKNPTDANYYYHWAEKLVPELTRRASGTTFLEISGSQFCQIRVPNPPESERVKIAQILDTLDTQIRQTEALIAKLERIKQGLLTDLLTRGIDQNGQLRPTPVQAPHLYKDSPLGRTPREWETKELSKIADLQVGYAFKSSWFRDTGRVRLLRGDNVGYGNPDWSTPKYLPDQLARDFEEYKLAVGDVVIGMDRTFTKSGTKVTTLRAEDVPCLLVQRVGRFLAIDCTRDFLRLLVSWPKFHRALQAQEKGMDIPHLSKSEILAPVMPRPPEEEQRRIVERALSLEKRFIAELEDARKLSVYRDGLMDDLLTGRVRVTPLLEEAHQRKG